VEHRRLLGRVLVPGAVQSLYEPDIEEVVDVFKGLVPGADFLVQDL